MIVKVGNKVVKQVNASKNGTFTTTLSQLGKRKITITLYAIDNVGNKSAEVKRIVNIK
jgi:hypothetical protein